MSIVDTAKDVYDLIKKGATIEVQEKLMSLREEALSLQEENLELRQRLSDIEAHVAAVEELSFDGRVYWRDLDGGQEGPFCQRCFDVDGRSIRLQSGHSTANGRTMRWWQCKACDKHYASV